MRDWLVELLGSEDAATYAQFALAVVAVLLLIALFSWVLRRLSNNRLVGRRNRQPRLAIMDVATIDARRRLVLIRRDSVEHLLLIGGTTDVVVESTIVRGVPAALLRQRGVPADAPAAGGVPAAPEPRAPVRAELADAGHRVPAAAERTPIDRSQATHAPEESPTFDRAPDRPSPTREQPAREQPAREQPVREPMGREQPVRDFAGRELAGQETGNREPIGREAPRDPATRDAIVREPPRDQSGRVQPPPLGVLPADAVASATIARLRPAQPRDPASVPPARADDAARRRRPEPGPRVEQGQRVEPVIGPQRPRAEAGPRPEPIRSETPSIPNAGAESRLADSRRNDTPRAWPRPADLPPSFAEMLPPEPVAPPREPPRPRDPTLRPPRQPGVAELAFRLDEALREPADGRSSAFVPPKRGPAAGVRTVVSGADATRDPAEAPTVVSAPSGEEPSAAALAAGAAGGIATSELAAAGAQPHGSEPAWTEPAAIAVPPAEEPAYPQDPVPVVAAAEPRAESAAPAPSVPRPAGPEIAQRSAGAPASGPDFGAAAARDIPVPVPAPTTIETTIALPPHDEPEPAIDWADAEVRLAPADEAPQRASEDAAPDWVEAVAEAPHPPEAAAPLAAPEPAPAASAPTVAVSAPRAIVDPGPPEAEPVLDIVPGAEAEAADAPAPPSAADIAEHESLTEDAHPEPAPIEIARPESPTGEPAAAEVPEVAVGDDAAEAPPVAVSADERPAPPPPGANRTQVAALEDEMARLLDELSGQRNDWASRNPTRK